VPRDPRTGRRVSSATITAVNRGTPPLTVAHTGRGTYEVTLSDPLESIHELNQRLALEGHRPEALVMSRANFQALEERYGRLGGLRAWLPPSNDENSFFGVNRSDRSPPTWNGVPIHADPNVPPGVVFALGQGFSFAQPSNVFAQAAEREFEQQRESLRRTFNAAMYGPDGALNSSGIPAQDGEDVAEWRTSYQTELRTTLPGMNGMAVIPELDESSIRFVAGEPPPPVRSRYERDVFDEAALRFFTDSPRGS
jgi:hypothetical protein